MTTNSAKGYTKSIKESFDNNKENIKNHISEILLTIIGLPILILFIFGMFSLFYYSNIIISIIVTFVLLLMLLIGIKDIISHQATKYSSYLGIRIFILLSITFIIFFGCASKLLSEFHLVVFSGMSPISLDDFLNYYFLSFLDLIPGIKAKEALGFTVDLRPEGIGASVLVLAFRASFIFGLLGSFKIWWQGRN